MKPSTGIRKLSQLAHSWGGSLLNVSKEEMSQFVKFSRRLGFYEAPFVAGKLGSFPAKKVVVYTDEDWCEWPNLIHEMGHVFASKKDIPFQDEYEFFGWEYAVVRLIGCPVDHWRECNADYVISVDGTISHEVGSLSDAEWEDFLEKRLIAAKSYGIVNRAGLPVSMR